ncbi:hypothetical protein Pmani_004462 [Petrolisthes manimaculis]|uniref:Arf-GAP domain-containing protein n=1 Tax=Petrolisthes manimaculis TaxID=1843537 RepID=A0AAE1QEM9_9EUCA|nr:hypothetical protein Pmani_004462 [Petrolisthes manimaculis]
MSSSSMSEKEKNKLIQDKCQTILSELLKDEDNKYCVDCDAKSPRWASWNLGIFLCIRCAGIHRNLGVHISRVKSVNLDSWTPQQVACIQQMGNSRARAVYEANIPDSFRRPQMDSALEQFVKAKYEAKKYIAREWVQPPMPNPTWDLELEKQLRKKKREKTSGTVELPAPVSTRASRGSSASPKPLPKAPGSKGASPIPSTKNTSTTHAPVVSSATQDLLGLDTVVSSGGGGVSSDLCDPFGEFLAAPGSQKTTASPAAPAAPPPSDSTKSEEENFFNQKLPEGSGGQNKMSKDSILALYSQAPPQPQPQTMFGVPPGVYMNPGGQATPQSMAQSMTQPIAQHMTPHHMGQPTSGLQNGGVMPHPQQNMMFMTQAGMGGAAGMPGAPGVPNPFFANGLPQSVPTSIQLSAANPFAQMQTQMANMSMGGQPGAVGQPQGFMGSTSGMVGGIGMGGIPGGAVMSDGMTGGRLGAAGTNTTLATKLWQ